MVALPMPSQPTAAHNFSGTWDMDKAASESAEPAMDALRMSFLARSAARLDDEQFEMTTFSALPGLKVVERYPLDGEERRHKRQDQRRGKLTGRVEVLVDGRARLHAGWGDPCGGSTTNTFSCHEAGVLHVDTCLRVKDRTVEYRTVFRLRA